MRIESSEDLSDLTIIHILSNRGFFMRSSVEEVQLEWNRRNVGELETKALIKAHNVLMTSLDESILNGRTKDGVIQELDKHEIDHNVVIQTLNFTIREKNSMFKPALILSIFSIYRIGSHGIEEATGKMFLVTLLMSIILMFREWNKD